MKKHKAIWLLLLTIVLVGLISHFAIKFNRAANQFQPMLARMADLNKEMEIAKAITLFITANAEPPRDIEQLVTEGFLPTESEIYLSPYHGLNRKINFKDSSYYIVTNPSASNKNGFFIQRRHLSVADDSAPEGYAEVNSVINESLRKQKRQP